MLGMMVRLSLAPVIACICVCSNKTESTSTGDREPSTKPGGARSALSVTVCEQPTTTAATHPISTTLADAVVVEINRSTRHRILLAE
jgi:hypothetical protein